jgi:glycerol-3-phosphate dehydrogenase
LTLDDVLTRRLRVSIETAHRGAESVWHAAALLGGVLGWDEDTRKRAVAEYLARLEGERQSQKMGDDEAALAAAAPPFADLG